MPVTQENKREFVQLSAQWRLYTSIKDQIEALLSGFYEIIPKDMITIVSRPFKSHFSSVLKADMCSSTRRSSSC